MSILTLSGRAAIAQAIAAQPLHFAWGFGLAAWDTAHAPEDVAATGLVNEIGRRAATRVQYVVEDLAGDIVVPVFNDPSGNLVTRRFSLSVHPTPHLYLFFNFDFADAPTAVIRELALFMGTTVAGGLPAGQKYFVPAELADPGSLLCIEHLHNALHRSANSRQAFEFVLTI